MCGFVVARGQADQSRVMRRGPEGSFEHHQAGFCFTHHLLSVTGSFAPQPFVDGDVVCVYNGEIYNQPFSRSDGDVLIPLYRRYGPEFVRRLDGEFALALYDFGRELAVFGTDPFKTKPLFVRGLECASYRSALGGEPARPNTVLIRGFDGRTLDEFPVVTWDLVQRRDGYEAWIAAFERAVAKRAVDRCFVGLSSGYDSGGITAALLKLNVEFKAFIYPRHENADVLRARRALVPHEEFMPDDRLLPWLRLHLDNEQYTIVEDGTRVRTSVLDDGATLGLATFAQLARLEGRKVCLSGQGADEVMTDYSPWPAQSELKGVFPAMLTLWRNFNFGCQESYLMKEEYAAGAFGIENRYPFLDTQVVQEFLWLSPEAKNRHYKAPLREYLLRRGFPFDEGAKLGFFVDRTT